MEKFLIWFKSFWESMNEQAAPVLEFLTTIQESPVVILFYMLISIISGSGLLLLWKKRNGSFLIKGDKYVPDTSLDTIRLALDKHKKAPKSSDVKGIESFQYSRRQDEFLGRDDLVDDIVTKFLDFKGKFTDEKAFRWTLIYGKAGTGKSRFALEVLRVAEKKFGKRFAICGFVERDFSDTSNSLSVQKIENWPYCKPALFILDYAGTNRELVAIIKAIQTKARQLKKPLRLMLLERRNDSGGIADLNRVGDEDRFLRHTCFELEDNHNDRIGIELKPLADEHIAKIMRNRILRERGSLGEGETQEWLLQRLNDIDMGERRPLFAAMVASAIADQPPQQAEVELGMVERLEKRDAMLRYLIQRDRKKYWEQPQDKESNLILGLHQNLLALATFDRGLDYTTINASQKYPEARIPDAQTFDNLRYSQMTTSNRQSHLPLGFLEPDFIGEWFVLNRLNPTVPIDPNESANKPDFYTFVNLAWQKGRDRAAQFIRQCHQNHPDTVQQLGYLLPRPGTFTDLVVLLLRDLLLDWRQSLSQISDTAQEHAIAKLIAGRAQEVFDLLKLHLDSVAQISDESKINLADATDTYLYIRCWQLSPSLRKLKDDRLEIIGTHKPMEKLRIPIHTSVKLQDIFIRESISDQLSEDENVMSGIDTMAKATETVSKNVRDISQALELLSDWKTSREQGDGVKASTKTTEVVNEDQQRESGIQIYELAVKLLNDAAAFFLTIAEQNAPVREQMNENSEVFKQLAAMLNDEPTGYVESTPICELAGKLLNDAAAFFRTIAEQNEPLREQMNENVEVFEEISRMVIEDPIKTLE